MMSAHRWFVSQKGHRTLSCHDCRALALFLPGCWNCTERRTLPMGKYPYAGSRDAPAAGAHVPVGPS